MAASSFTITFLFSFVIIALLLFLYIWSSNQLLWTQVLLLSCLNLTSCATPGKWQITHYLLRCDWKSNCNNFFLLLFRVLSTSRRRWPLHCWISVVVFQFQTGSVWTIPLWWMWRHCKSVLLPKGLHQDLHGIKNKISQF